MSETRRATVHYRRLVREHAAISDGVTLSRAIGEALDRRHPNGGSYRENWTCRLTPSPDDLDQRRLFNYVHTDAESAFGNLCAFTPGDLQALIDARALPGASASLAESIAPGDNEYVKGIAYWLAVGDHCYVVQTSAVRAKALEEYLTWFLRDATQTIGSAGSIMLQGAFEAASVGGDLDDIQSVEIGGLAPQTVRDSDLDARLSPETEREVEERRSLGARRAPFERARRILDILLGTASAERILETVPDEASLDVMVSIGYRATRRQVDRATMSELATSLRNIEDGEIKVRAKSGKLHGNLVWLQEPMSFRCLRPNGNLLDLEHARAQLLEVHRRFLHDGKIS